MRRSPSLLVCGLIALFAGCGSSAAKGPAIAPSPKPARVAKGERFPDALYIVAEGVSNVSFAEAEAAARNEVSARVQSELTSVVTSVAASTTASGQTADYQRLLSQTTSRTSFAHAEMIQPDPASRQLVDGVYHARAVLSRSEASAAIAHDYDLAAIDFRAASAELQRPSADLAAWTATLRRAEGGFSKVSTAAFSLRAITRREYEPYAADLAQYELAEQQRATKLSAVKLGLEVAGGAGDDGRLAAALGSALARLGLTSAPGKCDAGMLVLRLRPALTWEQGPFGPVCRLAMPGELVACDGDRSVARVAIDSKEFLGTHSRGREQALGALLDRVDASRLDPVLRRELAGCLPIAAR